MDPNLHSMFSGDGSSLQDPMFSGISLQSLLGFNPSFFTDYGFHTFASLTDPPNLPSEPTHITPKLVIPKTEPPSILIPTEEESPMMTLPSHHQQQQPFNFFPKYHQQQQPFDTFHRLPPLRSPEPSSFSDRKRLRHHPTPETTAPPPPPPPTPPVRGKAPSVIPQSSLARQRRQKLSEKTRCLQKLMPWDKKMDQATLLEEAYKYVKFLQAQFSVLQSMPSHTSPFLAATVHNNNNSNGGGGGVFGELERLNRSQILQVLVNSPVAQTMLYSQGFCVFSMEQLSLLRKLTERRQQQQQQQQQQQMSDHASSKTFFN